MQSIILAAGMGKRLKELTNDNTKCMVKVNGVTLIERMLRQIDSFNLNRIIIVVGYKGQKLIDYISTLNIKTPVHYVENPIYDKTNNIYSLQLAQDYLEQDDTLLFESDLIFESSIIKSLIEDPRPSLALVDKYESWMDGTCIKINEDDEIKEFIPGTHFKYEDAEEYYKTVNIYKFSKEFSSQRYIPFLNAYMKALGENEYYEQVLRVISNLDNPEIFAKKLNGELWYEIDDVQDLDIAESLFANDIHEKYNKISKRYGGYWRYPKLLDFSNPGNSEFPPQRLKDEIKASSDKLLNNYPSGMKVIRLLASKIWGVHSQSVIVVNGIESCLDILSNMNFTTGVIIPTRVNLQNRLGNKMVPMKLTSDDFSYTADDVIKFYSDSNNKIDCLFIYNPGYHTGYYLPKDEVIKLLKWTNKNNIKLIYDESTLDFVNENDSLINDETIEKFKNLIILKDMSVSHGILGIRLACVFTSDKEFLDDFEQKLSCWNIDSYSEFYLQIMEKYQKIYKASLDKFRVNKYIFSNNLNSIKELKIISDKSNYILCELKNMKSRNLCENLLDKYTILARDLSEQFGLKNKQYIKFSVRNKKENQVLIEALNNIFNK